MYSIISALSTPIIVLNASFHYLMWKKEGSPLTEEKISAIFKRQELWNMGIAGGLFIGGTAAVVLHATKFQKPTPLILSAMAYRIVAVTLISLATFTSGIVVYTWCADAARRGNL